MGIGERIKELRKNLGLNQTEFGKRIGISQTAIGQYENETRAITDRSITQISQAFNIREEWLRTGEGVREIQSNGNAIFNDPTLDDLDKAILSSYLSMPPSKRAIIKEWILGIAAAQAPPQAAPAPAPEEVEPCPPGITEEEWQLVKLHRKREAQEETEPDDPAIEEQVEKYRARLYAKEKTRRTLSGSTNTANTGTK